MTRRTVLAVVSVGAVIGMLGLGVLLGCGIALLDPPRDEWGYVGGKDTVDTFGGGRWAMVKTGGRATGDRRLHLSDRKTHETVAWDVIDWSSDGGRLYLLDRDGRYTILNLGAGGIDRYGSLEDAPEEVRRPLGDLKAR